MSLTTTILLAWMTTCCNHYKVEVPFARAVSVVECNSELDEIKTGPIDSRGRFWAPMGVARCFLGPPWYWRIDNPFVNIERGVRVLQGSLTTADKRRVLQNYNAKFNESYFREVMKAYKYFCDQEKKANDKRQTVLLGRGAVDGLPNETVHPGPQGHQGTAQLRRQVQP